MKIYELEWEYPLIYKAALDNQLAHKSMNDPSMCISRAFPWANTSQGHDFWNCIYRKDFDGAKTYYPKLFISKIGLIVLNNGLWL